MQEQISAMEATEIEKVKRLYKFLFNKEWPIWVDIIIGIHGALATMPTMFIGASRVEDAIDTLCHEFLHMEHPTWEHDERFMREVDKLVKRVVRY